MYYLRARYTKLVHFGNVTMRWGRFCPNHLGTINANPAMYLYTRWIVRKQAVKGAAQQAAPPVFKLRFGATASSEPLRVPRRALRPLCAFGCGLRERSLPVALRCRRLLFCACCLLGYLSCGSSPLSLRLRSNRAFKANSFARKRRAWDMAF